MAIHLSCLLHKCNVCVAHPDLQCKVYSYGSTHQKLPPFAFGFDAADTGKSWPFSIEHVMTHHPDLQIPNERQPCHAASVFTTAGQRALAPLCTQLDSLRAMV